MTDFCIVQLKTDSERYDCLITNESGELLTQHPQQTLENITLLSENKSVIAILPAQDTVVLTLTLPDMKRANLHKAIPYAAEETLSDDISHYHFTLLNYSEAGFAEVAVLEKKRIQYWLGLFTHQQIDLFIPAQLATTYQENTWQISVTGNTCLIRTSQYHGFFTDVDNLTELLEIHLEETTLPHQILIAEFGAQTPIDGEALSNRLNCPIKITQLTDDDYAQHLAKATLDNINCNILTGEFRPKSKHNRVKKYWRWALIFLIAWLCILFINKFIQISVYSHKNNKLNQQIVTIYKRNFPNATDIVAPKMRMQDKINQIRNVAGGNPFLNLMGQSGNTLKNLNSLTIENITYSNNTLALNVRLNNFSDLRTVIDMLKRHSLNVSQNNAKSVDNHVTATIMIKEST